MHTLALHQAWMLAAAHSGAAFASAGTASPHVVAGGAVTVAVAVVLGGVALIRTAMRGLTAVLGELLRAAARVTSLLVTTVLVVVVTAIMLLHG